MPHYAPQGLEVDFEWNVDESRGMHMASRARSPHKSPAESAATALPLEARIRIRAHEIYLERGGEDGNELDDWLQAEQEILGSEPGKERTK
jgi:hypothetical protein